VIFKLDFSLYCIANAAWSPLVSMISVTPFFLRQFGTLGASFSNSRESARPAGPLNASPVIQGSLAKPAKTPGSQRQSH
jgi:hypothetical protein